MAAKMLCGLPHSLSSLSNESFFLKKCSRHLLTFRVILFHALRISPNTESSKTYMENDATDSSLNTNFFDNKTIYK